MVSIIGAGPVGNYLASLLAAKGLPVNVYEEHKTVGSPVACTGILTPYLKDVIDVEEDYVVNTINETTVLSPDGRDVSIKLRKNYIVDRTLFDARLGEQARANGANYNIGGWRLTSFSKQSAGDYALYFGNNKQRHDDVIVGADGPSSIVARTAGLYGDRKFVVGHQARVHMDEPIDTDVVEFFLDEQMIGWLVPEDTHVARIGVASPKHVGEHFKKLLAQRPGKILGWQSGPIPLYDRTLASEKDNVYLLGDAATQVKATTYGGIIPGMLAGQVLCDVLAKEQPVGSYHKRWHKTVGRELWLHSLIRKIMDKFRQQDYNRLLRLCSQEKISKLIGKHDREYPSKLLMAMVMKEPRFLEFSKFLLKRN